MEGFERSTVIHRPTEEVFGYLADLAHDAAWRREWVAASNVSEGPIGVGSRFRLVARFLGRESATEYEVTEYEPNRSVAWKALSGPLPLRFRRTFESVEGGTRVAIRYDADIRGLLRLFGPPFARMGRRQLDGDLPVLKSLLETGASEPRP